jgi:DNA helicase-2/ATP-dependent DNA helicase PcrA
MRSPRLNQACRTDRQSTSVAHAAAHKNPHNDAVRVTPVWHNTPVPPELNPPQQAAVDHGGGPLLILAGAGSGKTRVITQRIAELIRRGVQPWRILAVTFTNKAAGEMRNRVEVATGGVEGLWIGTFHSVCARILRQHAEAAGLRRDFTIFDDGDVRSLMVRLLRDLEIADRFATPRAMLSAIDSAKNRGITAETYQGEDYFSDLVARVYPRYQERLRASNGVDFGDLLLEALRLCDDNEEVGDKLARRFDHVLVDEFQDTNNVQYRLVRHFTRHSHNLCVVGDDDQSIYRWRGADLRNILDFERDHPGCHVVKLEQNYRSTQIVLDAANAVIARNINRKEKHLFTEQSGGELIRYFTAADERREADWVVANVRRLEHDEGRTPDQFAVFYRTHAQSRVLEEAMRAADMPYTVVGGTRFYDRAEIKDLLAYLRVVANPADELSLERIYNRPPRGVGEGTYERAVESARASNMTVLEAMRRLVNAGGDELSAGPRKKLGVFVALLDELRESSRPSPSPDGARKGESMPGGLAALAERILERTGYLEKLAGERSIDAQDRAENLMELVGSMRDFEREMTAREGQPPTLVEYLERVSLVAPTDDAGRGVLMMTVHASKGLEFPVVFITGLEDGVFPSLRDGEDEELLEEERRLMYVAVTRARERLFFTNARARTLFGQEPRPFRESRFLADVPDGCVQTIGPRRHPSPAPPPLAWSNRDHQDQTAEEPRFAKHGRVVERDDVIIEYEPVEPSWDDIGFRLGQRIRHAKFGEGEIRGFTGMGNDLKLTVYFPTIGPKTVLARFVEAV